jgi:hypothetical protein
MPPAILPETLLFYLNLKGLPNVFACHAGTAGPPSASTLRVSVLIRYSKIAGGFLLLAAGIAMIALPGPGWLTIFAALAILAGEFLWARKLLDRLKSQVNRLRHRDTP